MQLFNTLVLDDSISGTVPLYTPAQFHDRLGSADSFVFLASATNVAGSLTVQAEHSADGQNWLNVAATAEINNVDLAGTGTAGPLQQGYVTGLGPVTLAFVRLRVSLAGTTPQCRLKITVTGRTS